MWLRSLLLLSVPACIAPQEPAPRFAVDVPFVTVAFTVRNREGGLLRQLSRDMVTVYEDGAPQTVRLFARELETPLTLGILLDRSPSQMNFDEENRRVATAFFKRVLRPGDRAFIAAFDAGIRELCEPAGSIERLESTLRQVSKLYWNSRRIGPEVSRDGLSAVLDAIYWSARERLEGVEGRKALIMIGDGKDNASKMPFEEVLALLQKEDIIFYGLDNGGNTGGDSPYLTDRMPALAAGSGGRDFRLSEARLAEAYDAIERELRALYIVGYVSSHAARDGRFRRIEIRPKDRGYVVRARPGYWAR